MQKGGGMSLLTEHDVYLFREGTHARLYDKLGSHPEPGGGTGAYFSVWAPNAETVSVIGDFNDWNPDLHLLKVREDGSGVWEGRVPDVPRGACYKYRIRSRVNGYVTDRADPFAIYSECPPKTGSRVWSLEYEWRDAEWMERRGRAAAHDAPLSIYEMHLGSWRRVPEEGNRSLTYREIAAPLAEYVTRMGFTHVELLPVMEHPFFGS